MDRQDYLLGIILSHTRAILVKYFGFWKVFYTCPPLLKDPFLADNDNLEDPTPNFWKKLSEDILGHEEWLLGIILSCN